MNFPRIKQFKFNITSVYTVPVQYAGRMDKIAYAIYENIRFYKPLAYANNIILPSGVRYGIRTNTESIENELIMKGYTGTELTAQIAFMQDNLRQTDADWNYYGDVTFGYMSDVPEGTLLMVPDKTSAITWLTKYEYLT